MASVRHRRKKKRNRGRFSMLFRLLCILTAGAAITLGATVFFEVETIQVTGNGRYTEEEVIAASGIQGGDNLFRMNRSAIARDIRQKLPYIGKVHLQLKLPSTIAIQVEEWEAAACIQVYHPQLGPDPPVEGEQGAEGRGDQSGSAQTPWLISSHGKLLEPVEEGVLHPTVEGLTLVNPVRSGYIEVPPQQMRDREGLLVLLTALEEMEMLEQVTRIDLSPVLWIELEYAGRFQVRITPEEDVIHELKILKAAVEKTLETYGEQAAGMIDLTQKEYDAIYTPAIGGNFS